MELVTFLTTFHLTDVFVLFFLWKKLKVLYKIPEIFLRIDDSLKEIGAISMTKWTFPDNFKIWLILVGSPVFDKFRNKRKVKKTEEMIYNIRKW